MSLLLFFFPGLSENKLEILANPATPVLKLSRRDLAMALSKVIVFLLVHTIVSLLL